MWSHDLCYSFANIYGVTFRKVITFVVPIVRKLYLIIEVTSLVMYFKKAKNLQILIIIQVHRQRDFV